MIVVGKACGLILILFSPSCIVDLGCGEVILVASHEFYKFHLK